MAPTTDDSLPLVVLDTDPGGDDALAILWLASLHHQGACKLLVMFRCQSGLDTPPLSRFARTPVCFHSQHTPSSFYFKILHRQ